MGMTDKSKFVFSETFNNSDGKTSGSGFAGILLTIVGAACFMAAMVGWFIEKPDVIEVMGKIIILLTIAGGLLGVRKVFRDKKDPNEPGDPGLDTNKG